MLSKKLPAMGVFLCHRHITSRYSRKLWVKIFFKYSQKTLDSWRKMVKSGEKWKRRDK